MWRKNIKKIQSLSSSCNIQCGEIKKIQRLVFSGGENALYCNGGVGACIFPAKKSSILQLEISICIFLTKKHAILQLAFGAEKLLAPHCSGKRLFFQENGGIIKSSNVAGDRSDKSNKERYSI